jgi:hypothetical protein
MSNLPAGISDFSSWATPEEEDLLRVVLEAGQAHVFKDWQVGADEAQKHAFFAQVATLEKNYPGGIRKYAANARKLLEMSAAGETTLDGYGLEVRGVAHAHTPPPASSHPRPPRPPTPIPSDANPCE